MAQLGKKRPCVDAGGVGWVDLSETDRALIKDAAARCSRCPFRQSCRDDLAERLQLGRHVYPIDQLVAGRFFNENGLEVSARRYYARDHRHPLAATA